ncbi:MAG: hypothetical protein K2H98_06165, partial [Duncaniella sp.]|nr:hypothetical protein [Duncaniella sp.]
DVDTARLSDSQEARLFLLAAFHQVVYPDLPPLTDADIGSGDSYFKGKFNTDEVKWLIVKSYDAKLKDNPVARLEYLKDAEFIAVQIDDMTDLGFIYLNLANVYEQGYNGTVSRYYADKAVKIFREMNYPLHLRDARMSVVGALCVQRDYDAALDTLEAMSEEVMRISTDSYKTFFLDQLARLYAENGSADKAINIWHGLYDGRDISSNTLAHWAMAFLTCNKPDSALLLIDRANRLPHNASDEYLCRNVQYQILESMGRKDSLAIIDSLRSVAAELVWGERKLEEGSLKLNVKYDSAAKEAWRQANNARFHKLIACFVSVILILGVLIVMLYFRKRNRMLRLEHENDVLKIRALQTDLFEKETSLRNVNSRISDLFSSRFNLLDSLAAAYFECRDTPQEQKRIYAEVKGALNYFSSDQMIRELTEVVNGYHDDIMDKFKGDFPRLSAARSRLALYLFCGFSLPSISIFTETELRNLYVYKSRLKALIAKSDSPRKADYMRFFE